MTIRYGNAVSTKETPQTEAIPGRESEMSQNNSVGLGFKVSKWDYLDRFLILGTETPTYYVEQRELTKGASKNVIDCIKDDGARVVNTIVDVSVNGRAPKNDHAIFALALACVHGNSQTKKMAYEAISKVCRIGTHIFSFCQAIQDLGGWSRGLRRGVAKFYNRRPDGLALQLIKYRQRDGWTHRDVLRLSHPAPESEIQNALFLYAVGKTEKNAVKYDAAMKIAPRLVHAFEEIQLLKSANSADVKKATDLIVGNKLPREAVPTDLLNSEAVWDALLQDMPLTAMIRNLGKMTAVGLLKSNLCDGVKLVVKKLNDHDALLKSRVHPLAILNALKTYAEGHGFKGSLVWNPVQKVVDVLNDAFYLAFENVEPTNQNWLLGVDVSGSMSGGQVSGMNLTPREASAAFALIIANREPNHEIMGFTGGFVPLKISPKQRLDSVIRYMEGLEFDNTNCALPMLYAMDHKIKVDTFVIITDSETNSDGIHPCQALVKYRKKMGIPARLVVVAMTGTSETIADPKDGGMLDIVGFDTAAPALIQQFSQGFGKNKGLATEE